MAAETYFILLNIEATKDLLDIFELEEGMHYFLGRTDKGISYFRIILDSVETQEFYKIIKDIDIYVPHIGIYISDYILFKQVPTREIKDLIAFFNVDQLFTAFIHTPKLIKMRKKLNELLDK